MRRYWRLGVALLGLAAAVVGLRLGLGVPSWLPGGKPAARNLLLVSLDTLRADRLGSYGYAAAQTPRLDALAGGGLRFANATTVAPLTLPAHSSLLTGTFLGHHGVRDNGGFYLGDEQQTLAETLQAHGFRTGGFVGAFVLDRRWGIAQGFERYFDEFDLSKFEGGGMDTVQRRGDEVVAKALEWLDEDDERPFFAWVHLYDPHTPYEAPQPYAGRFPRTQAGRYDAEVAWTDALVGRLLDGLTAQDRRDETVVVVVGDHGEALGEHDEQTHGFFLYDEVTQVPLIVQAPGLAAAVVEEQVRIVDVLPTALELLGVPVPAAVQGASLVPLTRGERLGLVALAESWYPRYHYGWSELVAVRDGRFKMIRAPRRELYDLARDPRERSDLSGADAARADRMAEALERLLATTASATAAKGPTSVDADTEERLQALGYVGGGFSPRHLEDRPRGDPKDKIGLYNLLKKAGTAASEDRLDEAIATARAALAQDPEIVEGHMLLGNFLRKQQRFDAAVAAYRAALALDAEHQGALYNLAVAYKDMGRPADARVGFERAAALDPRNGRVVWQLADLDLQEKRFDAAEARLKEALGRGIDEARFRQKLGECYVETGRFAEAEKELARALELRPDQPLTHYTLALAKEGLGDVAGAMAAYQAELAGNPKAFRASFNLGKLLLGQQRAREAAERFRQAIDASPDFAVGYLYLSKALLDAGDLRAAEVAARRGLDGKPDPKLAPLGHFVLADVYTREGRERDAARELAAAQRLQRGGA